MRRFISTGSACSAKLAEGSVRGAAAKKIGWLGRALPGSPFTPGRKRSGVFFSDRTKPDKCIRRRIAQRFLSAFRWSLYLAFAKMKRWDGRRSFLRPAVNRRPNDIQKETPMQKSRRLFFAFAAAGALGSVTLLTGCHHWHHRPPPPRDGRPGGPGPGARPGPGFGPRPGPR